MYIITMSNDRRERGERFLGPGVGLADKFLGVLNVSSYDLASLIRRQPIHHLLHLLIRIYPEPLLLGHARQLHVLAVQLLLHDLLQRFEDEQLRFLQGQRFVELVLQFRLRAFRPGSDRFGVVAVEGA